MMEDAVPATWPSGSMARALKFVPMNPKNPKAISVKGKNIQNGTCPSSTIAITQRSAEQAVKPSSALCDRRRMPSRSTSREFVKEADGDKDRSGGEGEGEQRSEAIDFLVDLLRRIEEAE